MTTSTRSAAIIFDEVYMDAVDHVLTKYDGRPPAGFNVQVGKDYNYNTILFYYDRAGRFIAWGRMLDEGVHLGRSNDPNLICRPADRSLLSADRRRILALGFNHTHDWGNYDGDLPTLPDQVWLFYVKRGEELSAQDLAF